MQSVVVTGTSTGIGWGAAKLLLDRGFRVFGSVRKQVDADRLQKEFGGNFGRCSSMSLTRRRCFLPRVWFVRL
jgi:NAD(P)-dependent dehydrogenase (short-subunit alcohol dehydrogenase family)